jgi:hypothetical protein
MTDGASTAESADDGSARMERGAHEIGLHQF